MADSACNAHSITTEQATGGGLGLRRAVVSGHPGRGHHGRGQWLHREVAGHRDRVGGQVAGGLAEIARRQAIRTRIDKAACRKTCARRCSRETHRATGPIGIGVHGVAAHHGLAGQRQVRDGVAAVVQIRDRSQNRVARSAIRRVAAGGLHQQLPGRHDGVSARHIAHRIVANGGVAHRHQHTAVLTCFVGRAVGARHRHANADASICWRLPTQQARDGIAAITGLVTLRHKLGTVDGGHRHRRRRDVGQARSLGTEQLVIARHARTQGDATGGHGLAHTHIGVVKAVAGRHCCGRSRICAEHTREAHRAVRGGSGVIDLAAGRDRWCQRGLGDAADCAADHGGQQVVRQLCGAAGQKVTVAQHDRHRLACAHVDRVVTAQRACDRRAVSAYPTRQRIVG